MNPRIVLVLTFALLISIGASFLVYRLGSRTKDSRLVPKVQILVAARDLEIGTIVHDSDLRLAEWEGSAPKGFAASRASAINRGIVSAIYEGEPIMQRRLASAGSGGGLAATIPAGMRACAVRVNEVVGVAGFVIPGMRVDVLITGIPPGASTETGPAVKTLLQNVQVLSAGENIDKDKEGKPQQVQVINLLVTPAQAEVLSLAGNETRIQLILRNPMDTTVTAPPGTVLAELFGTPKGRPIERSAAAMVSRPVASSPVLETVHNPISAPQTVEVMNGSTRTQARFPGVGIPQ